MNKDTIIKAQEQYTELMKSKEELQKAKKLLLEMDLSEENRNGCLKIIERQENMLPTEDGIIKYCFHNAIDDSSECNIYVFKGAYRVKHNKKTVEVTDYTKAQCFVYFNLEQMYTGVVIYPQEFSQFEKDNIVLRFNDNSNFNSKFEKLQCSYYKEYLTNPDISQDKVLEILNKKM